MPYPPTYQKVNPADQPILFLALTSPTLPLYDLDEYGETMIAQRISTVSGVAQVQVYGAQKYAVRVQLDPRALATRGIGIDEVAARGAERQRQPADRHPVGPGQVVHDPGRRASSRRAAAYRPIVVAYRNGKPVRLEELGHGLRQRRERQDRGLVRRPARDHPGDPAPARHQHRRGGDAGQATCCRPSRSSCRPASRCTCCSTARSRSDDSVNDVKFTLLVTLILVVLVIFLFLRNLSATVIPSLAMPMSIVGTFAVHVPARTTRSTTSR